MQLVNLIMFYVIFTESWVKGFKRLAIIVEEQSHDGENVHYVKGQFDIKECQWYLRSCSVMFLTLFYFCFAH